MSDLEILRRFKRVLNSTHRYRFKCLGFTNGVDCACFIGHYQRSIRNPRDFSIKNCSDYLNPRGIREVMKMDLVLEHMRWNKTTHYRVLKEVRNQIFATK